jgi:tripartite-type tricarboxylate transporter receptor subunit TctC
MSAREQIQKQDMDTHPTSPPLQRRMFILGGATASAALALAPGAAWAQAYPQRPVKILLGYAPGGTADFFARVVAQRLGGNLPQPFVVENKPGASGNIAAAQVAKAPADGYTLLYGNTAEMAVNRFFMQASGFQPERDFLPVAAINDVPLVLVVAGHSPYRSFADLVAAGRRPSANFSFASAGSGSPGHCAGVELSRRTGMATTHIAYKGASPAVVDVMAGHVTYYFAGLTSVTQHVASGALRVLAISSHQRSSLIKDVPTVREMTGEEFSFTLWGGLFAPTRTAAAVVQLLNQQVNQILQAPSVVAQFAREGSEVRPATPEAFGEFVRKESSRYQQLIAATGIKAE